MLESNERYQSFNQTQAPNRPVQDKMIAPETDTVQYSEANVDSPMDNADEKNDSDAEPQSKPEQCQIWCGNCLQNQKVWWTGFFAGEYSKQTYAKSALLFTLFIIIILAIVFNKTSGDILFGFLRWMRRNPELGAFVFIAVYFLATVLFVPGLILTVGAGFVFAQVAGQWLGVCIASLVVFIGAASGATAAMIIGRFVLREAVEQMASNYQNFVLIDKLVENNGLKVTVLLRLAPVVPFNALNYMMGLTSVTIKEYCLAHFGMIPGTIAYCFVGSTLGALSDSDNVGFTSDPVVLIVFITCMVVAFVGLFALGYYGKQEFAKMKEELERKQQATESKSEMEIAVDAA